MSMNWQQRGWPTFEYDLAPLERDLFVFADLSGKISGGVQALEKGMQSETLMEVMIAEAIKSSEIEGEYLSRPDVASSIRRGLGLSSLHKECRDAASQGFGELLVDARKGWSEPLDEEKLFQWHRMLMKGSRNIEVGCWRTHVEEMQVVSGPIGSEKILFRAPPSLRVPAEMKLFLAWFNATVQESILGPVHAALAHLYFESIHPFEDGNGRIGRVIAEKALARGLGRPVLMSLSQTLQQHRADYYSMLGEAQKTLKVTPWISWFIKQVLEAQQNTFDHVAFTLKKTRFFDHAKELLNDRQLLVIQRMAQEGPSGFEGGMNVKKYLALTKSSKATATRDLQDLVKKGIFIPLGGGRSTRYSLEFLRD